MADDKAFERRLELIERGVREIEAAADAGLRASAQGLVQALLELHATSLERLLEIVHESHEGQDLIDRLGRDALVSKLLLLHSLHPAPFEARVLRALDDVRALLRPHRGDVELIGIADGVVRVRIVGSGTLAPLVERAIMDAAPDVAAVHVENPAAQAAVGFVSLDSLRAADPTRRAAAAGLAV